MQLMTLDLEDGHRADIEVWEYSSSVLEKRGIFTGLDKELRADKLWRQGC